MLLALVSGYSVALGQTENQPIILTPFNEQVISSEAELRSTIFSWSGTQSNFGYQIAIYPVFPCQDPLTAFRVNHPIYYEYANDEFFFLTENMNFNDGTYVWSVTAGNSKQAWSPPSIFILETGNGSEIFIETGNPCDTPAGCAQIEVKPEEESDIQFRAQLPPGDQFNYPRALPIQLEGMDYDKVTFRCKGCDADDGTETRYYEDRVSQYDWVLLGKGSLGDAFKRKKRDSIQAEIDKINGKIDDLLGKIKAKQALLDSGIDAQIGKNNDRIDRLTDELKSLDSLISITDKVIDSLKEEKTKVVTKLTEKRTRLTSKLDSIEFIQERIDTLTGLLSGKFTPQELSILQQVEALNQQYESIVSEIENSKIDYEQQLRNQENTIRSLESSVRTLSTRYQTIRGQIENSTQTILRLENQLYVNTKLLEYYNARNNWRLILTAYNEKYPIPGFANQLAATDGKAQATATNRAGQVANFTSFKTNLNSLTQEAEKAHKKVNNQESREAYLMVLTASNGFVAALDTVTKSGVTIDPSIQLKITSVRDKLVSFESQVISVETQLNAAIKDFEKAVVKIDDIVSSYETKVQNLNRRKTDKFNEVSAKQSEFNTMVNRRKAETEKNKASYQQEIEEKELVKLRIKLSLTEIYESMIELQTDSTVITREIKFITFDKTELLRQKAAIEAEIQRLRDENRRLEEQKNSLRNDLKDLNRKLEKLQKDKEKLLGQLEEATKATKTASGAIVYYIPPTLDELMKDQGKEPEFKKLVQKLEKQKDSLKIAMKAKENLQKDFAQYAIDVAKELQTLKDIELAKKKAESDKSKADETVSKQKFESGKKLRQARIDEEAKRQELEEKKRKSTENVTKLEADKEELDKRFKRQMELVRKNDSLLNDIRDEIKERRDQIAELDQDENQRKSNISDNTEKLRAKKLEETQLIREIGQKRNAVTLASAQDNIPAIAENQKALNQLEKDLVKVREDVRFYVTELGIMAGKLKEIKDKKAKLYEEIKQREQKRSTININHRPNVDELFDLDRELEEASAELTQAKKEDLKLQAVDVDTAIQKESIDSLMAKDEDLQKAKKKAEELDAKIKQLDKDKDKAEKNIETIIDNKKKKKAKVKSDIEKAQKGVEEAEKKLKEFINGEFDRASFTTKIKITANDEVIDDWRSNDKEVVKTITLNYRNQVPYINDKTFFKTPANSKDPSSCYAIIKAEKGEKADVKIANPGREPRTLALLYDNGKLLYDRWPVIPVTCDSLLAKDVVITTIGLEDDKDELLYQCISAGESEEDKAIRIGEDVPAESSGNSESNRPITGTSGSSTTESSTTTTTTTTGTSTETGSEGGEEGPETPEEEEEDFCASPAGRKDPIKDMGHYTFVSQGIAGMRGRDDLGIFLWEPRDVQKDLETEKIQIKVKYRASSIKDDEEVGDLIKPKVLAGIMIETTDTVRGSPKGKAEITTRIVRGNHRGLGAESIRLTATSKHNNSTKYGFDENGTKTVTRKTKGDGYLETTHFYFGEDYDEFDIKVEWLRGGSPIAEANIYAEAPLLHKFQMLTYQVSKTAIVEGIKMVDNETSNATAALSNVDTGSRGDFLIFGTMNFDKEFVSDIELAFEVKGKPKLDPKSAKTGTFGIAYTQLKDAPENEQFEVTSKTPDKYKDVSKEHEVKGAVDTDKIKEFKIGSTLNPFIVQLDKEVSPGQAISGKGRLTIEGVSSDLSVIKVLKKLDLTIEGVELEKRGDDLIATAGKVIYKSEKGIDFKAFESFDFKLKSFGVTAAVGATITGNVKHTKLEEPIEFEAEIDPAGNFLGKLSNLPEIEVREFKLKKGASIVLDMHSDRSKDVIAYKGAFYGIVIQQASLELPKSFNREGVDEPTVISVEDFYISKEGFGGSIETKGQLLSAGFSGYECRLTDLTMKFDRNELKEGSFKGVMILPDPMEGEVGIGITAATDKFAAELSTDKPILLPQFQTTFVLKKAKVEYDFEKEIGTLELAALINSDKFGDVSIDGFVLKSNGEIKADSIKVEKDITIGAGFKMNLRKIGFDFKDRTKYAINFDGKVDFKGILAIDAKAKVNSGPSLVFDKLDIKFDKGPVKFDGGFTYKEAVFEGSFDITLKKCDKGLKGFIIVGNQQISKRESFGYWYGEITAPVKIPIAQTGFSFLSLGGGVGYNYVPPIGNAKGSPLKDGGFALKALVGVGNAPNGEVLEGRMEMTYVAGRFSLFGKAWLLSQEESVYGEGQINVDLNEPKVDGYIGAFIGLPDAKGNVFLARGKVNFSYPPNESRYVWTEDTRASLLKVLNAKASLVISETDVHMNGTLTYELEKEYNLGFGELNASFDLDAELDFRYVYKSKTATATPGLDGNWDVNIEAFSKTFDILSGGVVIKDSRLVVSPSRLEVKGYASVKYKVAFYKGTKQVQVDYSSAI